MDENNKGMISEMAEQLGKLHGFEVIDVNDPNDESVMAPVAVLPQGKTLESLSEFLDEYRTEPVRRKGTAKISNIASFVAHVNAFKDGESAVFALDNRVAPKLTAVYDYNPKGGIDKVSPRFGTHRAEFVPELSEPWRIWTGIEGKAMDQATFAAFIEDRISDVVLIDGPHIKETAELLEARVGGPSSLLKLSRGLQVSVNQTVANAITLSTGEVKVNFAETHTDEGAPITTPNLFFLGIPIFRGAEQYQVPVRLRYRLAGGKLSWSFILYRADKIFDDAFSGLVKMVAKECQVAVYAGAQEA